MRLKCEEEHVAAMTEDGHLAAIHHEAQVFQSGCNQWRLVFFHAKYACGRHGLTVHTRYKMLYINDLL